MTAVLTPADASVKFLRCLAVELFLPDLFFSRTVHPVGDSTVAEIVAAMREDRDFRDPLVKCGKLTAKHAGKRVVLASYTTNSCDGSCEGEVMEVTAHFDDGSSEGIQF